MNAFDLKKLFPAVAFVGLFAALLVKVAVAQNCGCAPNLCCSQYGYCGTTDDYCGTGCQEGPCEFTPTDENVDVADIVTTEFFDEIINQSSSTCEGKNFYSRDSFLEALESYPTFGTEGTVDDSKREIAAFFAHVTHETGHFCYINEINGATRNYCDANNTQYPCVTGKAYFGRGPLQLSWNFNYGPAGESIGFNGLSSPETVGQDPVIAFKTALWYWMNNVHSIIVSGQGFGETIRAINGAIECNGGNSAQVESRVSYYTDYCTQIGVDPGQNLRC